MNTSRMNEVTEDEFYSVIYGEGLNVSPFYNKTGEGTWHFINHGHQTPRVFGASITAYFDENGSYDYKKTYFLTGEL